MIRIGTRTQVCADLPPLCEIQQRLRTEIAFAHLHIVEDDGAYVEDFSGPDELPVA